jgi:hypothetical protein
MKKLFPLAFTLASLALIPSSALAALDGYDVFVINGEEHPVGSWDLSLNDQDTDGQVAGFEIPGTESCQYWVHWTNNTDEASIAWLRVDELQTAGFECELVPDTPQHTLISLAYGTNKGFDQWQQKRYVNFLVAGEDGENGELNGMIQFNGGSAYGFEGDPEGP